jgi:hypothetical protein
MQLTESEGKLFFKLFHPMLVYAAQKTQKVENVSSVDDLLKLPLQKVLLARTALYDQIDLIDSFVAENPLGVPEDELAIVSAWKNFVRGTFYAVRYLKDHAVFLTSDSPPKVYGVRALLSPFEEVIGPYLPVMLKTVLLPFKGWIVYDGLVEPYRISFGGGIRRDLNEAYQKAKARYGIITSFDAPVKQQSDAELLKFYLRTQVSREEYAGEIYQLIHKDKALLQFYHQEMGKIHATANKKQLRAIGMKPGWFATLEGIIVTGAATKEEVERIVQQIVPVDKREMVYVFQLKAR